MPSAPLALCILGMHRSGTSCLTGCLQEAGLYLGKHHQWNPYNQRGNRENQDICDLNDRVLAVNKASWREPVSNCRWTPAQLEEGKRLISHYQSFSQWGFKDPRSLLTIEGWQKIIGKLQYVGVFRHPMCVAESLHSRDGLPYDQSFALWLFYNYRLLHLRRKHSFPLLNFDWPKDIFESKVESLSESFSLIKDKTENHSFYSTELKHQLVPGWSEVPLSCRALYQELEAETAENCSNAISF